MNSYLMAVAEGVASQTNAVLGSPSQIGSEMTTALTVINLVSIFLALQKTWSEQLSKDAEAIFIANMNVPGNPSGTAGVAAATEKRNIDSTESDQQTGTIDNIIQGQKGAAQMEGNTLSSTVSLIEPINELLRTQVNALQGFLK